MSATDLAFSVRAEPAPDGVVQLVLSGDIDTAAIDALLAEVRGALDAGTAVIELEISQVEFFDCAGLGAFIEAYQLAKAAGRDLRVSGMTPQVDRVRSLAGYPLRRLGATVPD